MDKEEFMEHFMLALKDTFVAATEVENEEIKMRFLDGSYFSVCVKCLKKSDPQETKDRLQREAEEDLATEEYNEKFSLAERTHFLTKLKELKESKKIKIREMSQALGFSAATIANFLNGFMMPNKDKSIRMAYFFEVSPDELFGTPFEELMQRTGN